MNPQQADSLRILADFLECGVCGKFDMDLYFHTDRECGTRACALGWATTIPALQQRGLRRSGSGMPEFGLNRGLEAASEFFGLDHMEACRLFSPNTPVSRVWGEAKEAAAEIRLLLAEHGYAMPPSDDGFTAFKVKMLAPVALDNATV